MRNKDLYFCIWGDMGWYHVPISYRIGLPFVSMLLVRRKECDVIRQQKWHPQVYIPTIDLGYFSDLDLGALTL